jgi:NAD(P)-dependent dehydrogenase (short-subunit alcohol dehydrogenase family)|tara:strand:+ start:1988 stop:2803 length:816 start_codon:yes stop_codon:yes gene_type:complete
MKSTKQQSKITVLFILFIGWTSMSLSLCAEPAELSKAERGGLTVLITGANRGLGLEMVKQFKADGYSVIGTARSPEKATDLKATGAQVVKLDVTSEADISAMAKALKGRKIDILINNAGYFGPKLMTEKMHSLETVTRAEMMDCFAVNAAGPLFVTQALLPNLKLSKTAKIINISSRAGIITKGGIGGRAYGYRVSKTALNRVTKIMAGDIALKGSLVIAVAPGHNRTDMGTERGKLDPAVTMKKVKELIENLTPKHHGGFWYYDGTRVEW